MKALHVFIRNTILRIVDFFYPPFRKYMPLQTFRYAACGGGNTLLDIIIFTVSYNFLIHKEIVYIGPVAISPYIFAFIIAFVISFPLGFYLSRYVVWQQTETKKRIQVFRYLMVVVACILMNYFLLHFFIDYMHWWPTISKIMTAVVVITFSYFSQRFYSFKESKPTTVA